MQDAVLARLNSMSYNEDVMFSAFGAVRPPLKSWQRTVFTILGAAAAAAAIVLALRDPTPDQEALCTQIFNDDPKASAYKLGYIRSTLHTADPEGIVSFCREKFGLIVPPDNAKKAIERTK